ncbi:hypothetical protein PIIN_03553 [Serendipita indica DSM 11827]|uniref:Uncharacterized protein n=1 Tax=Serendipita indica (strain DSM 11827) TaxID=1109443 RepID=G4TE85_SERID|nr:hypothetical protein PIIN_03553 [Serendipita indica DSM 11827]
MASNLPIDFSHPSVKEYVALIRLQVLTPLSTLVHIATILATQFIVSPSLSKITKEYHHTSITPSTSLLGVYLLILWGLQIGYCFLIVIAWSEDTKKAIVHGTGMTLVFTNWVMAAYAVALSTQSFIPATVLISLVVLFLIFINLRLFFYYPVTWTQPFDYLLLHAPARLFLLVAGTLFLPLTVFMAIGHDWSLARDDLSYPWEGFAVIATMGVLGVVIAGWRRDLVWTIGTMWLLWCIGGLKPKSTPVMTGIIVFSVAIPLVFMASLILSVIYGRREEGRIRLEDEETIRAPPSATRTRPGQGDNHEVGDDVWG